MLDLDFDEMLPQIYTEATFYGKNKYILQFEKCMQIVLDECKKDPIDGYTNNRSNKAFRDAEKCIKECFHFKDVSINNSVIFDALAAACMIGHEPYTMLNIYGSSGVTVPASFIYKYINVLANKGELAHQVNIGEGRKGVALKDGTGLCFKTIIGKGDFLDHGDNNTLTAGEITAVTLHEIGHNFYQGPIQEFAFFEILMVCINIGNYIPFLTAIGSTEIIGVGSMIIDKILPREIVRKVHSLIYSICSDINGLVYIRKIITTFYNVLLFLLFTPKALINYLIERVNPYNLLKYDTEKYSDAFATSFGYGPELATALEKMTVSPPIPFKPNIKAANAFFSQLVTLNKALMLASYIATDCHPLEISRLINNINYLEAAGKNITDPKLLREYNTCISKMKMNLKRRRNVNSHSAENFSQYTDKGIILISEIIHLSDPRDIISVLNKDSKWTNLDFK